MINENFPIYGTGVHVVLQKTNTHSGTVGKLAKLRKYMYMYEHPIQPYLDHHDPTFTNLPSINELMEFLGQSLFFTCKCVSWQHKKRTHTHTHAQGVSGLLLPQAAIMEGKER